MKSFVKSPVVFKQKKSFKRRCSELFTGKTESPKTPKTMRTTVSDSFLRRNNRLFRSFQGNRRKSNSISKSSIDILDESVLTVEERCSSEPSILQKSLHQISNSKKAVGRRLSKSNEEIRNHFSRTKIEECMPVSYNEQIAPVPILRRKEQILNDDFVIWEEEMHQRRRIFITCI